MKDKKKINKTLVGWMYQYYYRN